MSGPDDAIRADRIGGTDRPVPGRRLLALLPLLVFFGIGLTFWLNMGRDPAQLPSALIDKPTPEFTLPPLPDRTDGGFSAAELGNGTVSLVNVFASWCMPCRIEHPVLMGLKADGLPIYGINYKDEPAKALAFLRQLGDPYARIGADRNGRVSIDWGVYGVPESFVVDGNGRIVFRFPGPLTPEILRDQLLPAIEKARG